MKFILLFLIVAVHPSRPVADGNFSYHLQGKTISGGKVDELKTNNIGSVSGGGASKKIQFFLSDAYDEKSDAVPHSLRFALPAKTGTFNLREDDDTGNVQLFLAKGTDGQYDIYGNEGFSVTITALSATRVSGTFSGKLKPVTAKGAEMVISDGKFDLPIRENGR